jgi:N-acetylmuramoyl-L-alanine amidase
MKISRLFLRTLSTAMTCVVLFGLNACSTLSDRGSYLVDSGHPTQYVGSRVQFLVMHYTALSMSDSLRVLTGQAVSAHYLVPDGPQSSGGKLIAYQLVPEAQRAWHAGVSEWQGTTELNGCSIGIENVNPGFRDTPQGRVWFPYSPKQIELIVALAKDIVVRYHIAPTRVVGHSDIAPQRKQDPGPLFPWKALADAGVGAWPDEATVNRYLDGRVPNAPLPTASIAALQARLARYGYAVPGTGALDVATTHVIAAFQMHFQPTDCSGVPDAQTEALLDALLEKYPGDRTPRQPFDMHESE